MRNYSFRLFLSALCLVSVWTAMIHKANAAPVQFNQVRQIVNPKPGKAGTAAFSTLRLADDRKDGDDETTGGTTAQPRQDDRVITETKVEIVEDEVCDCVEETVVKRRGFPAWALLGLAAIPLIFVFTDRDRDKTPTPTPTFPTETPTVTPTPTSETPTPTPPNTPTPTPPEPVPEPMTLLLFGTGLAGIGVAARKRFGKKKNN